MSASRVSICVPIFNNVNNFKNLFYSATNGYFNFHEDVEFIVYNDGSTVEGVHEELKDFCSLKRIRYLHNENNKGVAYAWNRLTEAASSEIVILLNDDVRIYSDSWIEHIKYVFEHNDQVGIVYWCQRQIDSLAGVFRGYTKDSADILLANNQKPYLRHGFCGAFFAFRKSVWSQIIQPDKSIGFWEDLLSYGEEIDFSSEFLNLGYSILQIPVIFEHLSSQTFAANPEKRLRKILSCYLSLEELHEILLSYPACFSLSKRDILLLKIARMNGNRFKFINEFRQMRESRANQVSRLDYSMAMLLKKWKNGIILGVNGEEYLQKVYMTGYPSALKDAIDDNTFNPSQNIHFLNKDNVAQVLSVDECINFSREPLI